jgi:hypothetical protein
MKPKDAPEDIEPEYQKLLALLSATLRYLEGIGADPNVLNSYRRLLRYLRSRQSVAIAEILGEPASKKKKSTDTSLPPPSDDDVVRMTPARIVELASNPDIPRAHLEKIAIVRFGMTKGGISSLRSRSALIDKLRTLIGNEGAHDAIARVAVKHRPE